MGLLTSDKSGKFNALAKPITNHASLISLVSFVAGIAVFGALISERYCDRTYFSDNALLPGLVNREFTLGSHAETLHEKLVTESKPYFGKIPYPWLLAQFRQIGLEVYTHNFTLHYPFGNKSKFPGQNVYAILRAPRAPSTEALVLSTPFRSSQSGHGSTLPGVALMLALAKYFAGKTYWAKDIIFLVGDHELVGIQAWLAAYHDMGRNPLSVLDYGTLEAVSGPIQAAVNLEIHSTKTSRLEIKIEGLNGQLVNLDLFNVAVELATRESVTPTFHGYSHSYQGSEWETWKQHAATIGAMMMAQGITLPTGAHGLFQKYAIQALTLEGIERTATGADSSYVPVSLLQLGRVIEGVFRSLNNLLERINRSYWFYLLPSTRRYVSIGFYMIPFALMALPLILKALQLYLALTSGSESSKSEKRAPSSAHGRATTLLDAFPTAFVSHALGLILLSIPFLVERYGHVISSSAEAKDLIYYSLVTFSTVFMFNPLIRIRKSSDLKLKSQKSVALLNLALMLSCLALVNISLALGLTLIYVPVTCVLSLKSSGAPLSPLATLKKYVDAVLLLLLHPLSINFLCLLGMSIVYDPDQSPVTHSVRAYEAQRKVILFYIEDWYIYGNWTYFFATAFLFPVWFQFWLVI